MYESFLFLTFQISELSVHFYFRQKSIYKTLLLLLLDITFILSLEPYLHSSALQLQNRTPRSGWGDIFKKATEKDGEGDS